MESKSQGDRSLSANTRQEKLGVGGSQAPQGAGSAKFLLPQTSEEDVTEQVSWNELANFALNYFELSKGSNRKLSEVLEINKILAVYQKSIIEQKRPLIDHPEFNPLMKIKEHVRLMKEGKFAWEAVVEDLDDLLAFLKPTVSKFFSTFDIELCNHRVVQVLFPLKLIYMYLSRVDRNYGKPVYDKTLRIQNCLAELFLYHHLKADTRFYPRLSTEVLAGSSIMYRQGVRQLNRGDEEFRKKYLGVGFNLKEVIFQWLDLYFPNVSWRYIGGGQELHRLILQSILTLFELGLWESQDLERLLIALFQKLENLAVLERRSYSDFLTSLVNYPLFISTLKEYFFECKEIVASISVHILYLATDERLLAEYSGVQSVSSRPWPILFRILTNYLLQFGGDSRDDQERWRKRTGLRDKISRVCGLLGGHGVDEYSLGGARGPVLQSPDTRALLAKSRLELLLDRLVGVTPGGEELQGAEVLDWCRQFTESATAPEQFLLSDENPLWRAGGLRKSRAAASFCVGVWQGDSLLDNTLPAAKLVGVVGHTAPGPHFIRDGVFRSPYVPKLSLLAFRSSQKSYDCFPGLLPPGLASLNRVSFAHSDVPPCSCDSAPFQCSFDAIDMNLSSEPTPNSRPPVCFTLCVDSEFCFDWNCSCVVRVSFFCSTAGSHRSSTLSISSNRFHHAITTI